ncbi:flavin-containing monooxygenase [Haloechinothrix halophila]|uniref:flavin-containing monooxygenase n=1 Tax=Haloechinothrix halophila TaxID=1069073 RepID=UPI0004025C21|nr:NAD(P)/FAD-dependent oxidoreductase [Haloechinothrix halophila]
MADDVHEVVIVGAGFAGICAAIRLKDAGIEDFVLLERADDVGGTWRDNRYPGVAVDIPSVTYQFSFEQKSDWRWVFARGAEVKDYVDDVVNRYGIRDHVRFRAEVIDAEFDEDAHRWRVTTADGRTRSARFLISAHGVFSQAKYPDIEGVKNFAGKTIHTLHWDHDHDLTGERVAVIGTGATSVQLVPEIAKQVERLDVYQRTPIWVVPRPDVRVPPAVRRLFGALPPARWAARAAVSAGIEIAMLAGVTNHTRLPFLVKGIRRLAERHLERQVPDPELRRRLRPQYEFGCKRPALSNDYWRSFTRDNVDLVTEKIQRVLPHGIETVDGQVREIDTLILATGFKFLEYDSVPGYPLRGEGGVDLRDWWVDNRYQAYEGISVTGFPNLFLIPAPHFATSWSWLVMVESQTRHAQRVISHARRSGATYAGVRPDAQRRFYREMDTGHEKTLFLNPSCAGSNTYYLDRDGRPSIVRPQSSVTARWRANRFPLDDYELRAG